MYLVPNKLEDVSFCYICPECDDQWTFSLKEVALPGYCYPCGCGNILRFKPITFSYVCEEPITQSSLPKTFNINDQYRDQENTTSDVVNNNVVNNNVVDSAKRILIGQGYKEQHIEQTIEKEMCNIKPSMVVEDVVREIVRNIN